MGIGLAEQVQNVCLRKTHGRIRATVGVIFKSILFVLKLFRIFQKLNYIQLFHWVYRMTTNQE